MAPLPGQEGKIGEIDAGALVEVVVVAADIMTDTSPLDSGKVALEAYYGPQQAKVAQNLLAIFVVTVVR